MSFTGKPTTIVDSTLENDGFFPDLNVRDLQELYRVPAEYHQQKVEHLLRIAMTEINAQLAAQKQRWQNAGHDTLETVSQSSLGGKKILLEQYQRAVFSHACANAFRQFATITRRDIGESQAKESVDTEQLYLTETNRALRFLNGKKTNLTAALL